MQCYVGICELEGTSGQPSAESNDNCTFECNKNNEMYVKFLNTNIYKLKNSLFTDARYIILTLNPINSNIGSCTENKKKGIYECICKPSYQIIVNERFYDHFLNVVNSNPEQNEDTIKREQFSVFAIFLKFYPQSALFYLAYLFEKCDLNSPLTVFNPSGRIISFRGHDVQGDGSGMVEDKGQFKGHGGKIFMEVYKLIANNKCNIRAVGKEYFYKTNTTIWCAVIILYAHIFKFFFSHAN